MLPAREIKQTVWLLVLKNLGEYRPNLISNNFCLVFSDKSVVDKPNVVRFCISDSNIEESTTILSTCKYNFSQPYLRLVYDETTHVLYWYFCYQTVSLKAEGGDELIYEIKSKEILKAMKQSSIAPKLPLWNRIRSAIYGNNSQYLGTFILNFSYKWDKTSDLDTGMDRVRVQFTSLVNYGWTCGSVVLY